MFNFVYLPILSIRIIKYFIFITFVYSQWLQEELEEYKGHLIIYEAKKKKISIRSAVSEKKMAFDGVFVVFGHSWIPKAICTDTMI